VTVFFRVAGPLAWPDAKEHAMTVTTPRELSEDQRAGLGEVPPAQLRLRLQPDRSGRGPLDGGWWPRSADPAAELPALILALDKQHDRVARVMLGTADWDASRPSRVRVGGPAGGRVVRVGWFASMPAGLLTAIFASGQRTDLVTIPLRAGEQAAAAAMERAAKAGNLEQAPAIVAAVGPGSS
jgi:Family of unknown function (DUF5994)